MTDMTKLGGSGSLPGPNISPMAAGGDAPAVPVSQTTLRSRFGALREAVKQAKSMALVDLQLTNHGALLGYRVEEGREIWNGTMMMVNYPLVGIMVASHE